MYCEDSIKLFTLLKGSLSQLTGGTYFKLGDIGFSVKGKDGLGGLIEEWFGHWAKSLKLDIQNAHDIRGSQEFPDYFVGASKDLLEIKTFNSNASAAFDLANFESYCESLAQNPSRINTDYLIFSYCLAGSQLSIKDIWLKKIWEISCPSDKWPVKVQDKRGIIYNLRPATWYSNRATYQPFESADHFVKALYRTQELYNGKNFLEIYLQNKSSSEHRMQVG